jgi:uncharacterized protein with NAD-binding domain and iron-sulfur cluster
MTAERKDKIRVAILGGGVAALTTAFELTEQDPEKTTYDVSLYTLGWRLGGKASVGRDMTKGGRAVEHGLHIWAGYYDNAFDLVQRLYARRDKEARDNGPDHWKDCFEPLNHFTAMEFIEEGGKGEWKPWLLQFPQNDLEPGLGPLPILTPLPLLIQFLSAMEDGFDRSDLPSHVAQDMRSETRRAIAELPDMRPLRDGETVLTLAREAAEHLPPNPGEAAAKVEVLQAVLAIGRRHVTRALDARVATDETRRLKIFYDLAFALVRGLLRDQVLFRGFESIDDQEWTQWMLSNDCSPESLDSAVVRGCYDYAFASGGGANPGIGAGTASLLFLRLLLTYKGSIMYALTEPMGDSIIAPLYRHLLKWGVKFEFFCRVKSVNLSPTEALVDKAVLAQQVRLNKGLQRYEPLISRADGHDSWPLHPLVEQIDHGEDLDGYDLESAWTDWPDAIPERVLKRRQAAGENESADVFDLVVLAMGFGGLEDICPEFKERFPETWGKCFQTLATTRTLAAQLWLRPQTDDLGWPDLQTALTAFQKPNDRWRAAPVNTWEDNTRLLRCESPRDGKARSLAYLVNSMPDEPSIPDPGTDAGYPEREREKAKRILRLWIERRLKILWPRFDWDALEAPHSAKGSRRLGYQYCQPNINPWERYVLAAPGSVHHRLWPDASGVDNLFLAGDWVRSGVNAGCLEAAVIGGRMAARAITEGDMVISSDGRNSGGLSLPIGVLPFVSAADKLKSAAAGGIGRVDAYCVPYLVDADKLKKLLPPGLRLATQSSWSGKHPLVLIFCRQRHVRPGFVPFGGIDYHEFVELIPSVERRDQDAPKGGPFGYMPQLLLDHLLPVAVGRNFYGFHKRMARISSRGGDFDINGDFGEVQGYFKTTGLPGTINRFPEIDGQRQFLEQPLISQLPTGAWVYSYLDYHLDTATFQRLDGEIRMDAPNAPIDDITPADPLSFPWFRMSTQWRISVPLSSGQLSDTSTQDQLRNVAAQLRRARNGTLF